MFHIFKTEIYKKYFPVKNTDIQFSNEELEIVLSWIRDFEFDLIELTYQMKKCGISYHPYFKIRDTDLDILEKKLIANEKLDNDSFWLLNIIIYRHKYKNIISWFRFPILTDRVMKKYFQKEINLFDASI